MSHKTTADVAKRLVIYLLQNEVLGMHAIFSRKDKFMSQRDAICERAKNSSLADFYKQALHPNISVTLNPDMPDNIYIEVTGEPGERDVFFDVLEELDGQISRAIGKSGKRVIVVDIPTDAEIAAEPRKTPHLRAPGAGMIGLSVPA